MQTRNDGLAGRVPVESPAAPGKVERVSKVAPPAPARSWSGSAQPDDAAARAAEAAQRALLDEIRRKGIYAWLQEQRFEQLRAEIRARLTRVRPYAHPAVIERDVNRELRQSIERTLKDQAAAAVERGEPARPLVIDIRI